MVGLEWYPCCRLKPATWIHYSSKFLRPKNIMLGYFPCVRTAYSHRCGVKKIAKLELQHKQSRFELQSWVFSLTVVLHYLSPRFPFSGVRIHAERPFQTLCLSIYMYAHQSRASKQNFARYDIVKFYKP